MVRRVRRLHFISLFNSGDSLAKVGWQFRASSLGPRLHFVFRGNVGDVGASFTHIDDIFGRGASSWEAEGPGIALCACGR